MRLDKADLEKLEGGPAFQPLHLCTECEAILALSNLPSLGG